MRPVADACDQSKTSIRGTAAIAQAGVGPGVEQPGCVWREVGFLLTTRRTVVDYRSP